MTPDCRLTWVAPAYLKAPSLSLGHLAWVLLLDNYFVLLHALCYKQATFEICGAPTCALLVSPEYHSSFVGVYIRLGYFIAGETGLSKLVLGSEQPSLEPRALSAWVSAS